MTDQLENILNDDNDIILHLMDTGVIFLRTLYNNKNIYESHEEKINNYHKMYLTQPDIFTDSLNKYIMDIVNNDTLLWSKIVALNEKNEVRDILYSMIKKMENLNFDIVIKFYYKMILDKNINEILIDPIFWNTKQKSLLKTTLLGIIISFKYVDTYNWKNKIKYVSDFITKLMGNRDILPHIINWFALACNLNTDRLYDYEIESDDNILYNSSFVIYNILFNLKSHDNVDWIRKIDSTYIIHKNCPISWYDKTIEGDKRYILATKLFFLYVNLWRVGIVPMMQVHMILNREKQRALNRISNNEYINDNMFMDHYKKMDEIDKNISYYNEITSNPLILECFDNYIEKISYWLLNGCNGEINVDDMLMDIFKYIEHLSHNNTEEKSTYIDMRNVYKMSESVNDMCVKIVGTKNITSNPDIRLDVCCVLLEYMISLEYNGDYDYNRSIVSILTLHNDLKNYPRELSDNLNGRTKIYKCMVVFLDRYTDYKIIMDDIFRKEQSIIQNFINIILSDISAIGDIIGDIDNTISNIDKNTLQYRRQYKMLSRLTKIIFSSFKFLLNFSECPHFLLVLSRKEHIMMFSGAMTMLRICAKYNGIKKSMNAEFINTIIDIIMNIYSCNKDTPEIMINSISNFNFEIFLKLKGHSKLSQFVQSCKIIIDNLNENDDLDYPDEFIDPISCTPIIDPVLLPNNGDIDTFHDRTTIVKHLLNKPENPYNRSPLTLSELETYNNEPVIKEKLQLFKIRITEWKNQQK